MLKKLALASVLSGVAMAGVSGANAATLTYGWEDGVGTVLGTFVSKNFVAHVACVCRG